MSVKNHLLELAEKLKAACPPGEFARRDEVLEVAAELRGISRGMPDDDEIKGMVKQIRGGHPALIADDMTMQARLEQQEARRKAFAEEARADSMVEIVGGPAGDTTVYVQGTPPPGGYTLIAGARYQFREGKLHHAPMTK